MWWLRDRREVLLAVLCFEWEWVSRAELVVPHKSGMCVMPLRCCGTGKPWISAVHDCGR